MTTELRILDREEFISRASYDLEAAQERRKKVTEKPMKASLAERAEQYNAARAEGMNPDEAALAAGWKNFTSAYNSCINGGIKISAKAPSGAAPAPKAAAICQDGEDAPPKPDKPEPVIEPDMPTPAPPRQLIPDVIQLDELKACTTRALRPCCWYGESFLYTDNGDYIEIKPHEGNSIRLTYEALKQFSEEINELLEIIK